jgi:hypothetical protein
MKPVRTGTSLALTVAIFYAACTAVWVLLPEPFMNFMNALFHGLDFRKLGAPSGFSWSSFFEAIIVLAVWAFAAGTVFGWLEGALLRDEKV